MASSGGEGGDEPDAEGSGGIETEIDDDAALCVVCPLETSHRKTVYLREAIDEWQRLAKLAADRLQSFEPWDRRTRNPNVYKMVKEQDDLDINAAVAREAVYKLTEAFESWQGNGRPGNPPVGEFGDGDYLRVGQQELEIAENDRGYGVKLSLVPHQPEWFHLDTVKYQNEWLERICDEDDAVRHGSAEVYLHEGSPALHLTVAPYPEVIVPDAVERWLGVDLGESALFATACVDVDDTTAIDGVVVEPGDEYRHHRERLKEKRAKLGRKGDLRGVKACKGDIERYTDWVLDTASKRIVELAADREACGIRLEDLTGYREDAPDPIHDWPFAELQSKITYKARLAGVPVEFVDPYGSSQLCNRCGEWRGRDGDEFRCEPCDYEVHADVNAAMRIAQGNPDAR